MPVSYNIDPNEGVKNSEANRAARLRNVGDELANEQTARTMEGQQELNAAWKGAYNAAAPVSQDQSGGQNVTTGQSQVQAVPVSPAPVSQGSRLSSMQVPSSALASSSAPDTSASSASIPTPPPATAFQGSPAAPTPPPAAPAAGPKASPFDSPQFQQALAEHLAGMPNGGLALQQIKHDRDAVIGKVLEAVGNGHTDAARYMAQQHGLNIPEELFQNSDLAQAMSLAQKAYPDEADKGQAFYHAFMATQGDLASRVNAGMSVAGVPTPASQRELQKAMALAKFNFGNDVALVKAKGAQEIETEKAKMGLLLDGLGGTAPTPAPSTAPAGSVAPQPPNAQPTFNPGGTMLAKKLGLENMQVVRGADGVVKVEPVPGVGGKLTDDQAKAAGFYDRMATSNSVIEESGTTDAGKSYWQKTLNNGLPIVGNPAGNYMVSGDYQKFDQATRDFVNAVLRRESGAAINPSEFESARKQYFPQPGDGKAVLVQKARNRAMAIAGMRRSAGPNYTAPAPSAPPNQQIPTFGDPNDPAFQSLPSGTQFMVPGETAQRVKN